MCSVIYFIYNCAALKHFDWNENVEISKAHKQRTEVPLSPKTVSNVPAVHPKSATRSKRPSPFISHARVLPAPPL